MAINLTIVLMYSGLLLYNLTFKSSDGSGLVWLIYLMLAIGLHWLVNIIGLVLTFRKTK